MGDKSEELATLVTAREIVMLHVIKFLGFSLVLLVSLSVMSGELDYRKLQYPLEDAKSSAQSVFPKFAGFIVEGVKKPRIPGLKQPQEDMVRQKYGINILNEYRLYEGFKPDQSKKDFQEKIILERYSTRYNRQLINALGL